MRFPSRYVLLVLAPLALNAGCSSRSLFKSSSGESVFSWNKKTVEEEAVAKEESGKADDKPEVADTRKKPAPPTPSEKNKASSLAKMSKETPASNRLQQAQDLERKGDFDGAAKIYRDILAEGAEDDAAKPRTRTASSSTDEKPKIVSKKPVERKSDSKDPWLDDLEPLPATSPKSEKKFAAAEPKDPQDAKPDWARRESVASGASDERKRMEQALRNSETDDLKDLGSLLEDEETPKSSVTTNRFAQRDAAADSKTSDESAIAGADRPNKFAPRTSTADAPDPAAGTKTEESLAETPAWAGPRSRPADEAGPAVKEIDSRQSIASLLESEPAEAEQAVPPLTASDDPPWKATRVATRAAGGDSLSEFARPVATAKADLAHPIAEVSATAPAFGEAPKIAPRTGWNNTSKERLCKDCDPLVLTEARKLDSPSPETRKDGIIELARLGSVARPACEAVRAMLDDADPMVQAYAAWALWELENETLDSVQVLGGLLANARPEVVELACYSLGNIGSPATAAVPALQDLRDHSHGVERLRAAEALIRIQDSDSRSVDVLTVAVKSADRQVRWIAANGLGQVRGKDASRAVETLTLTLDDPDEEVQAAAALALGGMGTPAETAIPKLEALRKSSTSFVRDAADATIKCLQR